jgi:hypothetical protein
MDLITFLHSRFFLKYNWEIDAIRMPGYFVVKDLETHKTG